MEAQTYVFLRDAGPKYMVLVVTIEAHDAVGGPGQPGAPDTGDADAETPTRWEKQ